jgi:hypothetical protein
MRQSWPKSATHPSRDSQPSFGARFLLLCVAALPFCFEEVEKGIGATQFLPCGLENQNVKLGKHAIMKRTFE